MKKGDYFEHKHWLDTTRGNSPLVCKVTRVAGGCVYWRAFHGTNDDGTENLGSKWRFDANESERYVARMVTP